MIEFLVLFTKQKTQKSKKWIEGILKFNPENRKGNLYDEANKLIDSKFFGKDEKIETGAELEMETVLVTIEKEKNLMEDFNQSQDRLSNHTNQLENLNQPSHNVLFKKRKLSQPSLRTGLNHKISATSPPFKEITKEELESVKIVPVVPEKGRSNSELLALLQSDKNQQGVSSSQIAESSFNLPLKKKPSFEPPRRMESVGQKTPEISFNSKPTSSSLPQITHLPKKKKMMMLRFLILRFLTCPPEPNLRTKNFQILMMKTFQSQIFSLLRI